MKYPLQNTNNNDCYVANFACTKSVSLFNLQSTSEISACDMKYVTLL